MFLRRGTTLAQGGGEGGGGGGGGRGVSYSDPHYVSIIACSTILRMVWATDHMFFEGPIKFQRLRDVIKVITTSGHELVILLASERLVYQGLRPEQRLTIHSFMKGNDIFIALTTGSRKSPFLPYAFDALYHREGSMVLVISLCRKSCTMLLCACVCTKEWQP